MNLAVFNLVFCDSANLAGALRQASDRDSLGWLNGNVRASSRPDNHFLIIYYDLKYLSGRRKNRALVIFHVNPLAEFVTASGKSNSMVGPADMNQTRPHPCPLPQEGRASWPPRKGMGPMGALAKSQRAAVGTAFFPPG